MTLDELKRLDPKKIGSWPILPKLSVLLIVLLLIVFASYWFDWQNQIEQIDVEKQKEERLRTAFLDKKKVAIDLPAYRKQLDDIEKQFGALLKQLPSKSEMDALLTDINQAGLGRGLQFELFRPGAESARDFYAELPITIKITGNYHDIGAFASDIGKLSRIVTLNDIALSSVKDGLVMDATAKTFRYLDEAEIAQQRKAAAAKSRPAAAKK
ncbi:MAG: pilus assembly protein PilO [Betaproteobacteria bacterium RIFCSPLOWO2_12_FULL_62_58]|nr:MAG: pilus assembly protein PilO [Betaproteobacteria bacterium RIFCSPLOWO2_02_FULL_62_79]OGA55218.1 MAG: pilus assembly protein PilO [Betaproteobacteria bacterium RIFCSPLOWO2_12_FULL_62_58]OGT03709.1 MAG: pilus assembly protein PilO [Gallionellales bacterium RIFCSPLOWO2_02_58_13]